MVQSAILQSAIRAIPGHWRARAQVMGAYPHRISLQILSHAAHPIKARETAVSQWGCIRP
eukprot:1423156-Alexandrium_andersonii.AAC.1